MSMGGHLNHDGGTLNLDGGTRPSPSPYNLSSDLNHISHVFRTAWKNLIAKIRKPFERIKLLSRFIPSLLPVQVQTTTRLNACIHE